MMTVFSLPPDDDDERPAVMRRGGWPAGRPRSEETKRKISASLMGRKRSEETKARIRAAQQYGLRDRLALARKLLNEIEAEVAQRPDLKPTREQRRAKAAAVPGHEYPDEQLWR